MTTGAAQPPPEPVPDIVVDRIAWRLPARITRTTRLFLATGLAAYLLGLVWTIPAAVVLPRTPAIAVPGGTLWRGRALLADGSSLEWRWAPLRSLVNLAFAADWTLVGPGTDLGGRALVGWRSVTVDKTSGSATGLLLSVALPNLGFACAMPMRVMLERMRLGGGDQRLAGLLSTDAGYCAPKGGGVATLMPPLAITLTPAGGTSAIRIAPAGQRREPLVTGTLYRDGRLRLQIDGNGARALPFVSPPGGMAIDTRL